MVTSKPPVEGISVVTVIRTDITIDHNQKAEKVCCAHGLTHWPTKHAFLTAAVRVLLASGFCNVTAQRCFGRFANCLCVRLTPACTYHDLGRGFLCWSLCVSALGAFTECITTTSPATCSRIINIVATGREHLQKRTQQFGIAHNFT